MPSPIASENHAREKRSSKQWTNKLASLVEEHSEPTPSSLSTNKIADLETQSHPLSSSALTSVRLEGPYFTPANPENYNTVVCLVAGTGISGAVAIAAAFCAQPNDTTDTLPRPATDKTPPTSDDSNAVTAKQRIWNRCIIIWSTRESDYIKLPFFEESTLGLEIRHHFTGAGKRRLDALQSIRELKGSEDGQRTWVYISGPNAFIEGGERACRDLDVDYYGARWS